jgi:hypothetical protein
MESVIREVKALESEERRLMWALLDSNVLARAVYSVGGPAEEVVKRLAISPHVVIL